MARGLNKVILIGNLGADPETRYLPSGGAVTNIRLATSESWKDRQTGENQTRTEWHRVVFFNKLAEIAGQYLKKGSKVYLEGSLRTRQWEQEGVKRYTTEIVGNEMLMLDSRGGAMGPEMGPDDHSFSDDFAAPSPSTSVNPQPTSTASAGSDDFDDDIPF